MTPVERLLAESGTCQIALDPLTADRSIRALGNVCGLLVGIEFGCTSDPQHAAALGEWREELAALRTILLIGRRLNQ